MAEAKHTPGPWAHHDLMVSEAGQQIGRGRDICHCGIGMRADPYESVANARLIAAAPELLEALQLIVQWDDEGFAQTEALIGKARAAIAKATGGAA